MSICGATTGPFAGRSGRAAGGRIEPDPEIWIDLADAMAKLDKKNPPEYWTDNCRRVEGLPQALGGLRRQHARHGRHDAGADGETDRAVALAVPDADHPGVSTLYLDHPSWYAGGRGARPGQQGQAVPHAQRQGRDLHPGAGPEAGRGRARGPADLLHPPGSDRQQPDDRVHGRAGPESGEPRRADAEGQDRRACGPAGPRDSRSWG